jgi:hypothetical protein
MALVLKDRVLETCTSPGTGTITLLGAVTGYQAFSTVGNGNTCYYAIADQNGANWEVGIGTYSSGTLARTTVLSSSNAGSLTNFSTGSQNVFLTYPSERSVNLSSAALTSGRVTFATTDGLLTDSANLVWDNTNARLGIGTSSSVTTLQVGSYTTNVGSIAIASTTTGNGSIFFGDGPTGSEYYRGYIQYEQTNDAFLFATSTIERMRISSTGNVGIGTSSPATALDVNGQITASNTIFSNGGFSGQGAYIQRNSTGGGTLGSLLSSGSVTFETNLTERMRIDSSGNVGIGATSPVAKLHVKGSGTSGQVTSSFILENSSSGTAGMDITGSAGASRWRFLYGGGPSTGTNALTEAMCIITEGATAGDVRIGASSNLGAKLSVKNTSTNTFNPSGYNGNTGLSLTTNSSSASDYSGIRFSNPTGSRENLFAVVQEAGGQGAFIWQSVPGGTTYTETMRLDSSGNLGIGTTSPTSKLHVQGTDVTGLYKASSTGVTYQIYQNNGGEFYVGRDDQAGGSFGKAYCNVLWGSGGVATVFATGNSEKMRLDSSGNLLVGTTTTASAVSNTKYVVGGTVYSFRGEVNSLATNTNYTMFTMTADYATYIVTVSGLVSAVIYSETAIVMLNNTSVSTTIIADGPLVTISNSGLNVQVAQLSGTTMGNLLWSAIRIL